MLEHTIDLARGPLDLGALQNVDALALDGVAVGPDALAAAIGALREVRGLKSLRLRSRVRALPAALTELRGLQRLELVDRELPGLPTAIGELSRLRSLRLEVFHLASLPRSASSLTHLRELDIDSHHLCGLPDGVRELQELRALTLRLRHVYVHDWERPAHVRPRFTQTLEALFEILAGLPALASLTLGEPDSAGYEERVLERLPAELGGLQALESLTVAEVARRVGLPHGVVLPAVRRVIGTGCLDATEAELWAMFPNATLSHRS